MNHRNRYRNILVVLSFILVPCLFLAQKSKWLSEVKGKIIRTIPTDANQGISVDKNYYYAISNTKISKHNKLTEEKVAEWIADTGVAAYSHFKHMNSGTIVGDKLYVAHSRYKIDPNDNTIEVFKISGALLEHERTITMPRSYGSLTWVDNLDDNSWWICYAVYGKTSNRNTRLVEYRFEDEKFVEMRNWYFPEEVVNQWGDMSCSGGSWGADGILYTTGHDNDIAYLLKIDESGELNYMGSRTNLGFYGQGIAWDRFSEIPALWGIVKRKYISVATIGR